MERLFFGICVLVIVASCSDWNRLKSIEEEWEKARDSATEDSETETDSKTEPPDTDTDTDTDSATTPGTDTDPDSETHSDSQTDDDTDSDTDVPTDTSCVAAGCTGDDPVCDTDDGLCVQCLDDGHCEKNFACDQGVKACHTTCTPPGEGCIADHYCAADTCLEEKTDGSPCGGNDHECASDHCENGFCCLEGICCAAHGDCSSDENAPICSTAFHCVACNGENAPGDGCLQGYPTTPHCKTGGSNCVECNEHPDCFISPEDPANEDRPYLSPLGACTPDNTCTCWVPQGDATSNCANCDQAGEGFVCARDFDDKKTPIPNIHAACLRKCDLQNSQNAEGGLRCLNPGEIDDYVWGPTEKTSCFSFKKFGVACPTESNAECSVDGTDPISDAICHDFGAGLGYRCTYSCADEGTPQDTWCPQSCIPGGEFSRCDYIL